MTMQLKGGLFRQTIALAYLKKLVSQSNYDEK